MTKSKHWQWIPTRLTLAQFEQFVLPHLLTGRRGPSPKLPLHGIFNYVLRVLHTGCQWQELPIKKDAKGLPEIHYTRVYRMFRYWQARGCIGAIFAGSVLTLHQRGYLDAIVGPEDRSPQQPIPKTPLPPQDAYSPARRVYADDVLSFNPWHCIPEHRPLGSIMRVRLKAYESSTSFRHAMNMQPRIEPHGIDEIPA